MNDKNVGLLIAASPVLLGLLLFIFYVIYSLFNRPKKTDRSHLFEFVKDEQERLHSLLKDFQWEDDLKKSNPEIKTEYSKTLAELSKINDFMIILIDRESEQ